MLSAEVLEGVQSVWAVVSAAPHPQALRTARRWRPAQLLISRQSATSKAYWSSLLEIGY